MSSESERVDGSNAVNRESPCKQLTLSREEKGLSVEDVARALKIAESYVIALEQGQFTQLPGTAFVRGYLKNYAKLLGLDGNALLEALALGVNSSAVTEPIPEIAAKPLLERRSSNTVRYTVSFVSVLLVIIVSYYWWNATQPSGVASGPVATEHTLPEPAENADSVAHTYPKPSLNPEKQPQNTEQSPLDQEAAPSLGAAQVSDPVAVIDDVPSVKPEKPASTEPDMAKLYIQFKGDCWMEVQDMAGNVLVSGVKKAGTVLDVSVPSEVRLRLGNAPGVELISFAGQKVDMPPKVQGQRVAKLMLTAAA